MKLSSLTVKLISRLIISSLLAFSSLCEAVDDLQLAIYESQLPQLRWDILKGKDEWFSGKRPVKNNGLYEVELGAGESLSVIQPAQSWLRLMSNESADWKRAIEITISTDGILFMPGELSLSQTKQSALLMPQNQAYIMRLKNKSNQLLKFSLYRSRIFMNAPEVLYTDAMSMQLNSVSMQITPDIGLQQFYHLPAMQSQQLTVAGPKRIAITLRRSLFNQTQPAAESHFSLYLDQQKIEKREIRFAEDNLHTFRVRGKRVVMSTPIVFYVHVPVGEHQLKIQSAAEVYLQINGLDNLYWSDKNLPKNTRWLNNIEDITSEKTVNKNYMNNFFLPIKDIEQRLYDQSKNNKNMDGALTALAELSILINQIPQKMWPERQALLQIQKNIQQRYTYFQALQLLPSEVYQQRVFRYTKQQLKFLKVKNHYYLAEQFYKQRLKKIGEQNFHQLSNQTMQYALTELQNPSEIQILVYQPENTSQNNTIWVQLDNQQAQKIMLREIPRLDSNIQQSLTQKVLNKQGCCPSVMGKLAVLNGSVPLVRVASVRLPVKAGATHIKVWMNKSQAPLWLALQQRRGSVYKLSEAQYLNQLQHSNAFQRFKHALSSLTQGDPQLSSPVGSLENHWLPMLKYFSVAYTKRIQILQVLKFNEYSKMSDDNIEKNQAKALNAEVSQQYITALEHWSKIWVSASQRKQQLALQHMILNLQYMGQHALAKQLQLAIVFSELPNDSPLVKALLESLLSSYSQQGNGDARVALLSSYFMHRSSVESMQQLVTVMLEEGRWLQGLQLLLLLPESKRPLSQVLLAALHAGWLTVFDQHLSKASLSIEQRNYWQGLNALFNLNYSLATTYFNAADDDKSALWLSILQQSQKLQVELLSADPGERNQAMQQWQILQSKINSSLLSDWKNEHVSVISHAGQLQIQQTDNQLQLMHYLSRPNKPLELKVAGPMQLKLQIRPLHQVSKKQLKALNSVYTVVDGEQKTHYLINHNLPAKNWRLQYKRNNKVIQGVPGQRINQQLILGAGVHRISIAGDGDLLIRLQRHSSQISSTVLPELNTQNMAMLVSGKNNDKPILHNAKLLKDWLSTDSQSASSPALKQLQNILLRLEAKPENTSELIAQAEKLYALSGHTAELAPTMSRLRRISRWDLLSTVESSDGFWLRHLDNGQVESPLSRVFQTLLPSSESSDQQVVADVLLRNGNSQIVSFYNPQASQLDIQLQALSPFFIRTENCLLSYQLDDGKVHTVSVSSSLTQLKLAPGKGQHSLKISLLQAPLQHQLGITLKEKNGQRVSLKKSRRYHLASYQKPLIYQLKGPVWLRIDKYIGGNTESEYRYLEAGGQQLKLSVAKGEQSGYFRVFKRTENQAIQAQHYSSAAQYIHNDIPKPVEKEQHKTKMVFQLHDGWKLGQQQRGTTSLLLTRVDQNLIIDELTISTDQYLETELAYREYLPPSQFKSSRWFYMAGVARLRQQGNASVGVKSRLRGKLSISPIDWTVDARAYAQQLESGTESSVQLQLRLSQTRWLGSRFYHLPKLDVFYRWLSADAEGANTNIDRDVYSDYKRDHPSGLRAAETLVFRPFQDMEFYTGFTLVSNSSSWIELDQYRSRVGARMQWGDVRWDLNARNLQFMADGNRQFASSRSIYQVRVLIEKWVTSQYRFELAGAVDYDVDSTDETVRVQLSVHQSEGRGYIDYSPAETLFRHVRQAKLSSQVNNELN
jgi:hypothetical protein